MKNFLIFFILIVIFYKPTKSQVFVGYSNIDENYVSHNEKDLSRLKSSTTIFVLPQQLIGFEDEIEQVFKDVWTISKYEIIDFKELGEYKKSGENYSFLTLDVLGYKNNYNLFASYYDIYFNLWMPGNTIKWSKANTSFARIYLSQTEESINICKGLFKKDESAVSYKLLYKKASFYNLSPGFLKVYLTILNKVLSNDKKVTFDSKVENEKEKISLLSNQKLYIPDYLLIKYTKSKKILNEKLDIKELTEDYPNKWELIRNEDLSKKIMDEKDNFCFLIFYIDDISKQYNIYNSNNFELVYSDYETKGGFNATSVFFKSLGKKLKKLK